MATLMQTPQTTPLSASKSCRFCGAKLQRTFVDLGMSPLCETYPSVEELNRGEVFFPLHVYVCEDCFLVQLEEFEAPENIFTNYAYFSSYSDSWLKHCELYTEQMRERFGLDSRSSVVEVASNDGYLLQYFVKQGIPVLGIEPAENVAKVAIEKGVPTLPKFFGTWLAKELVGGGKTADLIIGNNVLAQVPDLNDFVEGLKLLLKPAGVITLEFPHLLRLMRENEFDTIYHEHFSYFSFFTAEQVFARQGLKLFDVEKLPTHGGSLRIYGAHAEDRTKATSARVAQLLDEEARFGIADLRSYGNFAEQAKRTRRKLLEFLVDAKAAGKTIVGYGAPAKGNTLLNYCGVHSDLVGYTVD